MRLTPHAAAHLQQGQAQEQPEGWYMDTGVRTMGGCRVSCKGSRGQGEGGASSRKHTERASRETRLDCGFLGVSPVRGLILLTRYVHTKVTSAQVGRVVSLAHIEAYEEALGVTAKF